MKNGGRNGMKIGGRKCMKNGGRKCIRNGVLKRRVGLALSDTLSTPTGGQKNGGKIKPKYGENFGTKTGKIFVPAWPQETHSVKLNIQVESDGSLFGWDRLGYEIHPGPCRHSVASRARAAAARMPPGTAGRLHTS